MDVKEAIYTRRAVRDFTTEPVNDGTLRDSYNAQFEQQIQAYVPAIFLYSPDFIYAIPKTLRGVDLHAMTTPADQLNSVNDWYIDTEKVWNIGIFTKN